MTHSTLLSPGGAPGAIPQVRGSGTADDTQRHRSGARAPSVQPLLHPSEPSRLALAVVASALALALPLAFLIAAGGVAGVGELGLFLVFLLASIWFGIQLSRARLLGRSVRVDAHSFPALHQIVEEVRATLHYTRRFEVYVIESVTPNVRMTSLLGARLILIEGNLVGDLIEPVKRAQLTFLLGRSIGALRAKHERLDLVINILAAADVLKYVTPFILPYYRAIAYSGDQIGMMCCSDLAASLEATRRLLVGGQMAARIGNGAVLPQSLLVRRRLLPRLTQMLSAEPHVTNRYANLLCFCRYHDPQLWREMKPSMDPLELECIEALWQRSPYRRRVDAGGQLV